MLAGSYGSSVAYESCGNCGKKKEVKSSKLTVDREQRNHESSFGRLVSLLPREAENGWAPRFPRRRPAWRAAALRAFAPHLAAHKAVGRLISGGAPAHGYREHAARETAFCLRTKRSPLSGRRAPVASVKNGVGASEATWVMIHDSARPFVAPAVIDAVLHAARRFDGGHRRNFPKLNTVRNFSGDRAGETLDRSVIVRVQTPQLFLRAKLLLAFDAATRLSSPPPTRHCSWRPWALQWASRTGIALNSRSRHKGIWNWLKRYGRNGTPSVNKPRHAEALPAGRHEFNPVRSSHPTYPRSFPFRNSCKGIFRFPIISAPRQAWSSGIPAAGLKRAVCVCRDIQIPGPAGAEAESRGSQLHLCQRDWSRR